MFSGFGTIVDVGGGATGNLLAAFFAEHLGPRGVLFDRAHVVAEEAPALSTRPGSRGAVTIETGDFFEGVPPTGDAYILSHVWHDWSEPQCLAILGQCRSWRCVITGQLLIVEMALPNGDAPHPGKILDMAMLVLLGGQERTEAEYASPLSRGRFSSVPRDSNPHTGQHNRGHAGRCNLIETAA